MRRVLLAPVVALACVAGCGGERAPLAAIERPSDAGPSTRAASDERVRFERVATFDRRAGVGGFATVRDRLLVGDCIAYWLPPGEALRDSARGQLNHLGYGLLRYGHLAIVVPDPDDGCRFRLLSSQAFRGPNTDEDPDTLATHSFDVWRLDRAWAIHQDRLEEFVQLARASGGGWWGYDFLGMFGIWNSELRPERPSEIGSGYICSTVVAAALHYAGVELDAVRGQHLDLCSPAQVVAGGGRIVDPRSRRPQPPPAPAWQERGRR